MAEYYVGIDIGGTSVKFAVLEDNKPTDEKTEFLFWEKWLCNLFMQDKIGAVFEAIVASVTEFGLFVRTNDSFADGFVPLRALTDDFYDFDAEHLTLIGRNGGCCYRLGDRVQVILREASPLTGGLIFSIKHPNRKHPSKQHKKKR